MMYFDNQEQAVELFDKIKPIAEKHRVIFLVVKRTQFIGPLVHDLSILLQSFPQKRGITYLRILGTKENRAQTINVVLDDKDKLAGINKEQIIYV